MNYKETFQVVQPHIVKIETPHGSGTGFLFQYNCDKKICAVATAYHVISSAHKWDEPIQIHHSSGKYKRLPAGNLRQIEADPYNDSAVIIFYSEGLPFPEDIIPLWPQESSLLTGTEVGWVGY